MSRVGRAVATDVIRLVSVDLKTSYPVPSGLFSGCKKYKSLLTIWASSNRAHAFIKLPKGLTEEGIYEFIGYLVDYAKYPDFWSFEEHAHEPSTITDLFTLAEFFGFNEALWCLGHEYRRTPDCLTETQWKVIKKSLANEVNDVKLYVLPLPF